MTDFASEAAAMPAPATTAPTDAVTSSSPPVPKYDFDAQAAAMPSPEKVADDTQSQVELKTSMQMYDDPDIYAKAMGIGKQFDLPAPAILPNLEQYKAQAEADKTNQIMRDSPNLAAWYTDSPDSVVAKGDFDNLDALSKIAFTLKQADYQVMGQQLGRAESYRDINSGLGLDTSSNDSDITNLKNELAISGDFQPTGGYAKTAWWLNQGAGLLDNILHALPEVGAGALTGAVAGLPEGGIGAIPLALMGAGVGLKVGLAGDWATIAHGQALEALSNYRDRNGDPMSEEGIQGGAAITAALTAGVGMVGAPSQGAAVKDVLTSLVGDAVKGALTKPTTAIALTNLAKSTALGSGEMAAIMGAMTLSTQIGQEVGKQISPGDWDTVINDPKTRAQYASQLAEAIGNGLTVGAALHGVGGAIGEYGNYKQSEAMQQQFGQLMDKSPDSLTRQRSPDVFQNFMQSQLQNTSAENVYVSADKIQGLYDRAKVTPDVDDGIFGKAVPDIADQLKQAAPINGDIVIPSDAYAAHIAGTPMDKALRPDLRVTQDGMSLNQLAEFKDKYQDVLSKIGGLLDEQREVDAPVNKVYEDMHQQAKSVGFTDSQAAAYAQIASSRYALLGSQFDKTAFDMYSDQGIKLRRGVEGESPDAALNAFPAKQVPNAITLDDLEKNTRAQIKGENRPVSDLLDYLKGEKTLPRDKTQLSLTAFLKKEGGIKDEAGEMKNMEANKVVKGLVRKTGMSHDEAAEKAWMAGYIGKPDENRPDIGVLRDAIRQDLLSRDVFSSHEDLLDKGMRAQAEDLNELLDRHEVPIEGRDNADIIKELQDKGLVSWHTAEEFSQSAKYKDASDFSDSISKEYGINVALHDQKDGLHLASIKVPDDNQGGGVGTEVMNKITDYADSQNKRITLSPSTDFGATYVARLNEFYKRFGFVENKGKNKDFSTRETMIREPVKQEFNQSDRAKITISEGQHIITLFEGHDKSSILHELGHIWLNELQSYAMREDAPDQLKADWDKVKKYIGHDEGVIKEESHEIWARSLEQYFMEGKAPSQSLQGAFRRFKQWLTNIYRTVKNLNVPLNDDIRGVFDRMLATDDEITQMENRQAVNKLFRTKEEAGMTDAEFKAYNDKALNAEQSAREQLLSEAMEEVKKKAGGEWNKAAAELKPNVADAIHSRQDIRSLDWFKTGKMRDQAGNVAEIPKMAIDKTALEQVSPGAAKDMPRGVPVEDGGAHPDEIAPLLGYDSGKAMVDDMRELGKTEKNAGRQQVENYLTDQVINSKLQEKFGVSDDQLRARALELMGSPDRMELKLAEIRALSRKTGNSVTFTKENIGQWADDHISNMRANDAANSYQFVRAVGKAGRDATRALEKGDDNSALQALQRQALNMALADRAKAVEKEYNSGQKLFKYASSKPTIKSTDQGYLNQVHALLSQFGFRVNRDPRELQSSLGGKSLKDFVVDKVGIGRDVYAPDYLMDTTLPAYKSLSVAQFNDLHDMVQSLMHNGRDEQSVTVEGKKIEKDRVITEILNNLDAFSEKPKSEFLNPADAGFLRRGLDKFTSMVRAADSELLRPEQFLDWLDKRDVLGPLNKYVFRPLKDAQVKENDLLAEQAKAFRDLDISGDWHKTLGDEVFNDKLIDPDNGNPARLSRKTMLTIALNTGNESNMKKLAEGYGWKRDDISDFLQKNMSKDDWDFVQHSWDSFEKLWPEIEAMQRRTSGVAPPKIDATPIKTPHGDYRGGYYPVVYDPNKTRVGERAQSAEGIFDHDYYRPTTSQGHTIARVQNFTDKILLNLDVMPWKLRQAIHDLSFREAIVNADKILSDDRFKDKLKSTWGQEYGKEFRPWLRDIANQPNADNRPMSFIDNALRYSRMTMVEMGIGFRLTTMFKHGLTALSNSVGELGPDAMRRGVQEYYSDRAGKQEFVMERSGEMRHRMTQYDRDIRENMASLMGEHSILQTMRHFGHYGVAFLDMESALPTWIGAYRKALADGMEDKDAVYSADKTVRNAHGAQGQVDMAGVQRGPEYKKLFTMFYGFFSHMYSRERDITRLAQESPDGHDMAKILGKTLTYILVPALVEQAISGQSQPDEHWGKWASKAVANQMASTIPLVRDVSGYLEHGRAQETPMSRTIRALGDQAKDIGNLAAGDKVSDKWVKHAIETPGYVTGAPTGQLATGAQYLWDVSDGKENPKDVKDWMHGLMYGTSKQK